MQLIDTNYTILRAGRILTGPSINLEKNVIIKINGGIITSITPASYSPAKEVLDFSNYTLIPGPVDCHVHLALDGIDFKSCLEKWHNREIMKQLIKKQLYTSLEYGITCLRDGGDRGGITLTLKDVNSAGPLVKASGAALRIKDMYGSFLGPGLAKNHLKETVSYLAKKNADQIKVLVTGVVSFKEYGRVGPIQFDLPALQKIVQTAGENGLKVMAHANSDEAVRTCLQAGVHSIEHGYFLSRDTLKIMAQKGIYWIPTIVPVANQLKKPYRQRYSKEEHNVIEKTFKRQQEMLCIAREMGVPLGVGTDAGASGVLHGTGFHEELRLYCEAGLSPEAILKAATIEGSRLLGLDSGLEQGKPPRFTVVAGNPLKDLTVLKTPRYIAL